MVNTKIGLILFFAAKVSQNKIGKNKKEKKQDWELTVAQIMNSLWYDLN